MKAIRVPCRKCRRSYALNQDGTVRDHYALTGRRRRCPGAGKRPARAGW